MRMTSATISTKGLIGHPTFSRSIESHGSAHSADTNYNGWRGEGMSGNEDMATQTDFNSGTGNMSSSSGRALLGELKRRREDAILDISLESMKYNGGTQEETLNFSLTQRTYPVRRLSFTLKGVKRKFSFLMCHHQTVCSLIGEDASNRISLPLAEWEIFFLFSLSFALSLAVFIGLFEDRSTESNSMQEKKKRERERRMIIDRHSFSCSLFFSFFSLSLSVSFSSRIPYLF